jgi:hypothetical protein
MKMDSEKKGQMGTQEIFSTYRLAITGQYTVTPSIPLADICEVLGRDETLKRLKYATEEAESLKIVDTK